MKDLFDLEFEPYNGNINGLTHVVLIAVQDVFEMQRQYYIGECMDGTYYLGIRGIDTDNKRDMTYHKTIEEAKEYASNINHIYMTIKYINRLNYTAQNINYQLLPVDERDHVCLRCGSLSKYKININDKDHYFCNKCFIVVVGNCAYGRNAYSTIDLTNKIKSNVKIHYPDKIHHWGIEYNYDPYFHDSDASKFIRACYDTLFDKNIFKGTWFHQSGIGTQTGYQFFEYWGDDAEACALRAAIIISKKLKCEIYDEKK